VKRAVRVALPLEVRKVLARFLGRQPWLSSRSWWVQELLRDLAERDPNAYHRFLWGHHLGYAETYEIGTRFGGDRIHRSRRLLFDDLEACLATLGTPPERVESVFEVGCSLGYNLRFLETDLFRQARVLEGCDIDEYAIEQGNGYLREAGSSVRLFREDMAHLSRLLDGRRFDVTLCAGVLMYLRQEDAEPVVHSLLRHTGIVAAFAGLADPEQDNVTLPASRVRTADGSFVHDLDGMVTRAGGRVVQRRWEGPRQVHGNSLYFVFATPAPS
jgi:SAM-dependent methyltransferase